MPKIKTEINNRKILFEGGTRDRQFAWFPAGVLAINISENESYVVTDRKKEGAVIFEVKGD